MTVEIDGIDLVAAAQIAGLVGSVVAMLVIGVVIYLLVRPPRHVRKARGKRVELQESEAEELLSVIDRMESRLEVLERALADHGGQLPETREPRILEVADNGQEARRTK